MTDAAQPQGQSFNLADFARSADWRIEADRILANAGADRILQHVKKT